MRLLDQLRSQFNETQDQLRALTDEIADQGTPATEEQSANLATLNSGIETLVPRIEQATTMANRMTGAAELLAGVPGDLDARLRSSHRPAPTTRWENFGDYARALASGEVDDASRESIDRMRSQLVTRQRDRQFNRALVDEITSDVPGLLPPTWLTDITDLIGTARPFISAFDSRPLPPSGMTINYPQITQRPLTSVVAAEKTAIPSGKMLVGTGVANVQTYAGGQDVSVQVIQRTEPAYLSLMLEVFAEELAIDTDVAAIAVANTAVTQTVSIGTDPTKYNAQLAAAKLVMANRAVPDTLVVGVDMWAALAGASDSGGRPLFPNAAPSNPVGSSALNSDTGTARGLTFVVDPMMPAATGVLGSSRAFTSMLSGIQTLSADNPALLGKDVAVYEFAAFACRRPGALVKLTMTVIP